MVTKALNIFPTSLVFLEGTLPTFKVRKKESDFGKEDTLVMVALGGGSQ